MCDLGWVGPNSRLHQNTNGTKLKKNDIISALQFHFDLASLNEADMPELEPIEFKNDSDDDITEMFRNPSNGEIPANSFSSFSGNRS